MPERPKRRKNNKNKRKNKNNRPDTNKATGESTNSEAGTQNTELKPDNAPQTINSENQTTNFISVAVNQTNEIQSVSNSICVESHDLPQDLNNNSDAVVAVSNPTICPVIEDLENIEIEVQSYVVESPEQSAKNRSKLNNTTKSKSLDNEEATKIIDITEEIDSQVEDECTLAAIETNNVLISDVDSDIEWEKTEDFNEALESETKEIATGTLSITNIPLDIARCDETKSLTPEAEESLRHYLKTLNLATQPADVSSIEIKTEIEQIINREIRHRLRKKGLAEDFLCPRLGPARILDVIDEEGSSESSVTSRRQSHISDRKSDNEDLDDDVFEDKNKISEKYATKSVRLLSNKSFGHQIPQQCVLVGTKIKQPEITEARGDWSVKTVEKMAGAEVVYLTDSSSSTSSLHDFGDEPDDDVDTDVSVRMITPIIEVIDTESLLKKTFTPITCSNTMVVQNDDADKMSNQSVHITETKVNGNNEDNHTGGSAQNEHEIVVLSIDNITTNLYVKDVEENPKTEHNDKVAHTLSRDIITKLESNKETGKDENIQKSSEDYDLEMKVLKCELNDAINNLIKEVSSDSESNNENPKEIFTRQDSSSSVCSSQCTAKYNPSYSSLNDVSNMLHDDTCDNNTEVVQNTNSSSHVKDVFECVTGTSTHKKDIVVNEPSALRDLCVKKIATFPYGDKILEELAYVSKRLQNIAVLGSTPNNVTELNNQHQTESSTVYEVKQKSKMPYYPLPDLSSISTVALETQNQKEPVPPPVQPRNSSLKKSQDDHWTGLPTKIEPVYVCLSPSQKMLMEKTNTVLTKENASQLVDMHKKFVDRRGYHEYYKDKYKEQKQSDNPLVVPFKSQTGSRLLALIRDPAVTSNINSSIGKHIKHTSADQLEHNYTQRERMSKKLHDQFNSIKDFSSSFKPIPPPRPRKYSSSFYESDESSDFTDSSHRSMRSEKKFFHYSTGNLNQEIENEVSTIQNMHRYYTHTRDQLSSQNTPRRPSLPKDLCEQQMEYIRQKEKEVEAEIRRLEVKKFDAMSPEKHGPRAPLISDKENVKDNVTKSQKSFSSQKISKSQLPDKNDKSKLSSVFSSSQEEILRDKMYSEYVNQMAQREERKQHKLIKITNYPATGSKTVSKSMSALDVLDSKVNNPIEKEFISKARDRWDKLGIRDPETEDERESAKDVYKEPKVIEHKIKVIEGGEEKDVKKLPSHLQDFVRFTAKDKEQSGDSAVWRPGAPTPPPAPAPVQCAARSPGAPPPPPPPVWTPGSAGPSPQAPRKNFRPVHFEETPPARHKFPSSEQNGCTSGSESESRLRTSFSAPASGLNSLGSSLSTSRLPRAQNPTVTLLQKAREGQIPRGSNYLQQEKDGVRLPRDRPSPPRGDPVHALRKEYASEGEADRSDYERGGSHKMADAHRKVEGIGPTTKEGMPVALRSEVKDQSRWYKKMYDTIHKNKYDDDYVTIRYKSRRGQPPQRVSNKSQYAYFDPRSGYLSEPEGGLSRLGLSTWSDAYDSDVTTGPRRRTASVQEERRNDINSPYLPSNKYSTLASARASHEVYKNQPGRIENYVPGKSSVVDKEAKQWWDEVMDIFDGWLDDNSPLPPYTTLLARAIQKSQNLSSTTSLPQASPKEKKDLTSTILSKSNMARALKESGYESDSTLVFRRRDDTEAPLSPAERRAAYKDLQAGGEPPLRGFRSPAPPRQESDSAPEPPRRSSYGSYSDTDLPKSTYEKERPRENSDTKREENRHTLHDFSEWVNRTTTYPDVYAPLPYKSPRRYVESDVNIHYRCPVRHDPLPLVPERELARQQAEHMKRLYREQKRNKYLQENEIHPQDIDAFDAYIKELQDMQSRRHQDNFTPAQKNILPLNRYDDAEKIVARALYAFNGQTARELSFRKGDLLHVRRQIDANWYEGELHGRIGLFPYNYVEILKGDAAQSPRKPAVIEGRARAKFDFTAQTNLELPLKKGELVVLTRKIDQNWWEGRNGNKTGIFPDSYVTILQEPSQSKLEPQQISNTEKPVASPAAHGLLNGSAKRSMGSHSYTPQQNSQALSNAPPATQPLPGYVAKPVQATMTPSERGYGPPTGAGVDLNNTEPLYVDTNAEAIPYRAMYKYRPQNPDELELNEGDTVYVLEQCDDGWYVGSSQRTGRFGTFPGNYVERI